MNTKPEVHTKYIFALLAVLTLVGCEPPTLPSLTGGIPEWTRTRNWADWSAKTATFNVWGLPVISKNKKERMPAIGEAINKKEFDVIMLEEAWLKDGRNDIAKSAQMPFRHDFIFDKAPLDSGLMTLSQSRVDRTAFRAFQLFGPVILPDAWAVKGIGMVTTKINDLPTSFFSTHLMAGLPRFEETRSPFTPEWKAEMFELLAHVIEQTDSDSFVIGGDFNIHYGDEEYFFWKKFSSLEGTYLEETLNLCTWCKDNTWAKTWERQIDYLFVSPRLKIQSAWVDFKERIQIDDKSKSLSDHYGLSAVIDVNQGASHITPEKAKEGFLWGLADLKAELVEYGKKKEKEEEETKKAIGTRGLDDRLCQSCRVKKVLGMIENYENALSEKNNEFLSEEQRKLRVRTDSWFALFRDQN